MSYIRKETTMLEQQGEQAPDGDALRRPTWRVREYLKTRSARYITMWDCENVKDGYTRKPAIL